VSVNCSGALCRRVVLCIIHTLWISAYVYILCEGWVKVWVRVYYTFIRDNNMWYRISFVSATWMYTICDDDDEGKRHTKAVGFRRRLLLYTAVGDDVSTDEARYSEDLWTQEHRLFYYNNMELYHKYGI
jgi:hypothetical protein